MPDPKIKSQRLHLTPLEADDAEALFAYRSLPEVGRYQSFVPKTLEETAAWVERAIEQPFATPGAWTQLGIRRRDDGGLIGDLGVHVQGDDPRQVEIGISLAPSAQGQGFAGEALRALLGHLFESLEKHRIHASVDPRNEAALALLDRVGMRREAYFKQSYWFRGEWADDVVCAMLRSEWPSN